ncbi:hypothetical protein OQJ13_00190 [Legionella sp. PATHC035]|uniref:hypothetical protein n=1 Tax=Legionella sp. PATHC035 TaxID=2992040 RepID=UPI0022439866|nr:hypothetical protein [Legionella sp. PATHC035]MCW8407389.1 hypothetical protein [Legionella sp. PATHC035]
MTRTKAELEAEKQAANKTSLEGAEKLRKEQRDKEYNAALETEQAKQRQQWAKVMDELRSKHKLKNRKEGGPETYWEEVEQLADHLINSDQNSTIDWRSNMMSLLNLLTKLNKAINISSEQVAGEALDLVKQATRPFPVFGHLFHPNEKIYQSLKTAILHKVIQGKGDFELPILEHKVSFKDGKVKVADLTRADRIPLNNENEANKALKKFVDIWLEEQGYIPVPNPNAPVNSGKVYKHHATGVLLNEDKFNELNNDPQTSFATFLKQNATLKYDEQREAQSTPASP